MKNKLKTSKLFIVLAASVLLLLLAVIGAVYFQMKSSRVNPAPSPSVSVGEASVLGKTQDEVREEFGEPDASEANSALKKEIWVYMLNVDDSTARYIYFQNGTVVNTRNDEFNGTFESETWLSAP